MPTAKPRITITLEPHVYEVLRRLSAAGGDSMSSVVTDFLGVAVPTLERLVVVLEQANAMPKQARDGIRASVAKAESEMLPALMAAVGQSDMFLGEMARLTSPEGGAAGAPEARTGRRPEGSTPVPVTRGSGPVRPAKKVQVKGGRA